MDITETLAPKSDQLNAEDLLTGPRTVTVEKVTKGSVEQPVDIHLVEFPGRPFRPSKTVRRILVAAWGPEASIYVGRRMTLYRDADVKFGGMDVGGIRVSHLSHISKRLTLALTVTRGKRAPFTVEPLPDVPAAITEDAGMSADNRRKWVNRMFQLLNEAGASDRDDQLVVIAELADRKDSPPEHRDGITDAELRAVVTKLNELDKSGALTQQVGDILDNHAIDLAQQGTPEPAPEPQP
jgi:hypothetical protein